MLVIVAEVEDEGILGMDFLSESDPHIDIVKNRSAMRTCVAYEVELL